jgi:hypothetical protein
LKAELAHPVDQRTGAAALRLDVHALVAVDRIHDRGQVEPLRIGAREAAVAVDRPLHRRAHAVAIAEVDVVAHPDLVAVIDDRRSRHREQQARHQFDLAPVVLHQRREPPPDADVDARARLGRVDATHERAFAIGHHLERHLVVVAQEDRPLAVLGNLRRLAHDVDDRVAILFGDRHEHARHQRKVERHVAFVAVAEIRAHVFGPLVGFGEQHRSRYSRRARAQRLEHAVRLGQVLAVVPSRSHRYGTASSRMPSTPMSSQKRITSTIASNTRGLIEVEIGLVAEEAMPVVLPATGSQVQFDVSVSVKMMRVPAYFSSRIAPHVEVAPDGAAGRARARWNHACWSEVWLTTSSVITRMPSSCAAFMKARKSRSVPYAG